MGFLLRCHSEIMPQFALEENILILLELQRGSSPVQLGCQGTS